MALVNCHECGAQVSTEAVACAKCGAPLKPKATTRTVFKVLGYFVLVLLVIGVLAVRHPGSATDSDQEEAAGPVEAPVRVSAQELVAAYKENTVAADNRFKGRRLLIDGVVASIDTDFRNDAYLSLVGPSEFERVQAHLASDAKQTAASLRPGANVRLTCVGNGDIIKTPMLKDCVFSSRQDAAAQPARQAQPTVTSLPVDQLSEQQFDAQFRCPETYATDDESRSGLAESVQWYGTHHSQVTVEGVVNFRMKLLTEHGCTKTLANMRGDSSAETSTTGAVQDRASSQQAVSPSPSLPSNATQTRSGPSFDCLKARSTPEKIICSDPGLAALDAGLLTYFKATRAAVHANLSAEQYAGFIAENKEAWKSRETRCEDKECLVAWYAWRGRQFAEWNKLASR